MNRTPRRNRLADLARQSILLSLLSHLTDALYRLAPRSLIGALLTGYRPERDRTENSGFYRLLCSHRFSVKRRILLPAKRFCNRIFSQSRLLGSINSGMRRLVDMPVRFYGTLLFSFGIYTAALDLLMVWGFSLSGFAAHHTLTSLLISLSSFPMLFSSRPLSEALGRSVFARFLLCSVLGYSPGDLVPRSRPRGRTAMALILSILLSILTVQIPILSIFVGLLILVCAYLILRTPEVGVVLLFLTLPFLPTMRFAALLILTILSFLLKLMQGRRSLSLELLDYAVLAFLLFVLAGGIFGLSPTVSVPPALLMCCFMGSYFLIVSTVKTTATVKHCLTALTLSVTLESVLALGEWLIGTPDNRWQDPTLFASLSGRVVGTLQNPNVLGEYLILALPFLLALIRRQDKPLGRFLALLPVALSAVALILTWSRGAWIGMLVSLVLYALLTSHVALPSMALVGAASPLLTLLLPASITDRLLSAFNLADSSIAYRIHIWEGCLPMAADRLLGGIGTGVDAFAMVYPSYALSGIERAPHSHSLYLEALIEWGLPGLICLLLMLFLFFQSSFTHLAAPSEPSEAPTRHITAAGISAVAGFMIMGLTDYVWYNYRIFAFFWMLVALVSAARRSADAERTVCIPDDNYVACGQKESKS